MPPHIARTSPIIVERDPELAALDRLRAEAAAGSCRVALIVGDAGVGKSRLAREATTRAATAGFDRLVGRCTERDRDFPFAPVVDALRQRLAVPGADPETLLGPQLPDLVDLLPEHRHLAPPTAGPAPATPEHHQRRLFETLGALLRRLAADQPLLLLLEDLHWADPTSLALLELLPRRLEHAPVLIIATCRASEARHEVIHSLVTLQREQAAQLITLAPLSETGTAAMLNAMLPAPSPSLVATLHARAAGNPLLIEELLAMLPATGPWTLPDPAVPATVRDLVARQLATLDAPTRQVASIAAIAGERVSLEVVQPLTAMPPGDLMASLRTLVERGILTEARAGGNQGIVFRHALIRDALLEHLLPPERQALHHQVAARIETAAPDPRSPATAGALGYHYHRAEQWEPALTYALRAGEAAWHVRAAPEAAAHLRRALDAALALDDRRAGRIHCRLGEALALLGDVDDAATHLDRARDLAAIHDDPALALDALDALAGLHASRDYPTAIAFAEAALDRARTLGDPAREAHARNRLGNMLTNVLRTAEGRALHASALALVQHGDDRWSVADTLDYLGMSRYLSGDVPGARAAFGEAAAIFTTLGDAERAASALASRGLLHAVVDGACPADVSPEDARRDAEAGLHRSHEIGWRAGEAYALVAVATTELTAARHGDAHAHATEALAIAREIDHPQWQVIATFGLALIHTDLEDDATALRHLREACRLAHAIGSRQWMERLDAWITRCALRLEPRPVPGFLPPTAAPPATLGQRRALLTAAERALAAGQPDRAAAALQPLLDTDGGLRHPEIALLHAGILAAQDERDAADAALRTARDLAERHGPRGMGWRVAAQRARLWHGVDPVLARAEGARARETIAAITVTLPDDATRERFLAAPAVAPWLAPAERQRTRRTPAPGGLTPRERDVAIRVARGLTNKEIARALGIAEKTVEMHVGTCLGKLGFASRAQIAAWAVAEGLTPASRPPGDTGTTS